jgi:hypothetical protein
MRNTGFIAAALFLQILTGYAGETRPHESAPGSGDLERRMTSSRAAPRRAGSDYEPK